MARNGIGVVQSAGKRGGVMGRMLPLISIAGAIVLLDQVTKALVLRLMPLYSETIVVPGFFNLVHVRNTGAAFSFLAGANSLWRQAFFVTLSLIGIGVILYAYTRTTREERWNRIALALLFGGAFGNLIDRLRFGEVVDFLDFYVGSHHWPAFNVADSAITVGAFTLILALLRSR